MRQEVVRRAAGPHVVLRDGVAAAWPAIRRAGRRSAQVVARTIRFYSDDHCGTYAAAIAYYAIFSVVPLGLITLSIFGLVVDERRIVEFVFDELPLQDTESVRSNVVEIVSRAREASVLGLGIGLGILVWSSSGIFTAIRRGLNAATRTKRGRPFLKAKLIDFTLIPCFGTLIVLAVAAMAVIQIGIENAQDIGPLEIDPNAATRAASSVVGAVVSFVGFLLLYRFVPRTRPRWGEAIAGALFATLLFEAAKQLYALVFALLPYSRDTALYAGFGTALTFLLWMFINASILLLGAEFARALRATGPRVDRDAEGFVKPFQ